MDGQEPPALAEFINHPSFRQTATFFLGFVFISCIHFSYHVPVALARRFRACLTGRGRSAQGELSLEANTAYGEEKVHGWLGYPHVDHASSLSSTQESYNIALSLTLCFAMASIAEFGSLLVFDRKAQAGCAFLVAWGGMSAQAARLLGLLKLSLDLRKMGVHRLETFIFWGWLVFALVIMFVSNAISIGTIQEIPSMPGSGICFRRHFLATAVVSSVVDVVLEVYCFLRIIYLVAPTFLSAKHQLDAVFDVRSFRALSLLILDLASAAPAAKFFGVLTDVIPASLGALLVLAAFNMRSPDMSLATTASIPPTRAGSVHSRSTIEIKKMPSSQSLRSRDGRISHPFAARALQDPAPETEDWTETASPDHLEKSYFSPEITSPQRSGRRWRASTQSTMSETDSEVARSVKGAVVAFAFKDSVGQSRRKSRDRRSFLPTMPSMSEIPKSQTLPRSTPLRIPQPIIPAPVMHVAALERASEDPAIGLPIAPRPSISVTTATPVSPQRQEAPTSPPTSASVSASASASLAHRSIPPTMQSDSSYSVKTSSLHLTPTTLSHSQSHSQSHSHSHPSQRGSGESNITGESWRYDSRHDSLTSEQRSSDESSPTQARRQSGGSSSRLPPADDDLSIVYEASHEDSESIPPSRAYRPTFGEHMFVQGGLARSVSPPADVPQDVPQDVQGEGEGSGSNRSVASLNRI